jgi:trans-aconitate methyltransferase
MTVRTLLRDKWMGAVLRKVGPKDQHKRLDMAYVIEDPWNLDSPRQYARFAGTNAQILAAFGHVGTALEIGCGEGVQTMTLTEVADNVTGIDISPRAIERARRRLPTVTFHAGDLHEQPWVNEPNQFDLVVACEVLYYMSDIPRTLAAMTSLAPHRFVTYYAPRGDIVAHHLANIPGLQTSTLESEGTTWHTAWW